MSSSTQDGYPAFFDQGVAIENAMAFQSVINGTGTAVSPSFGGPGDVVTYS
jgi:hypothetical protein